jgi:hypothetical protein
MKEQLLELINTIGSQDVLDAIADVTRRMFMTLKREGFTDEQAMLIVQNISKQK